MIKKFFYLNLILFLIIFFNNRLLANYVADMSGISEAAGESAVAAASQLSNDTSAITENITNVTQALGAATTEVGTKLDVSIAQAKEAMESQVFFSFSADIRLIELNSCYRFHKD